MFFDHFRPAAILALTVALTLAAGCEAPEQEQASEPVAEPVTLFSELQCDNRELIADYISPTADEVQWRAIPWLPTFAEGMRAAGDQEQPLLFWAMNGHPLGCT